ncbi:MAG: DMT family transporter [Sandarakinorhabdus sp.]|nr:DMT family transporter [Sandarakinorhabdus sp.]
MTSRSIVQFIAVVLIWSTSWIMIKFQLGEVNPSWSVAYRFAVGGAALLGWCLLKGIPLHLPRHGWGFLLVFGLFQFVLNFNFVYRAELYIPSGLLAVAFALLMVPNAILARLWLGSRVTRRFIAGSALGVIGVFMLFAQQLNLPGARDAALIGLGLTAAGVMSASVANVMQATPRARSLPPLAGLGWAMLAGAAVNAVIAFVVAGPPQWDTRPEYLAGLLALGIFASALAFALYFDLIRTIGPAEAAWTGVPIPIIAMLISTFVEGWVWTLLSLGGSALALIGLIVALRQPGTRQDREQAEAPPEPEPLPASRK